MTGSQEIANGEGRSSEEIKRPVTEFEASGLRQNEFCRNHGLALSTLHRQLKRRRVDKDEAKEGSPGRSLLSTSPSLAKLGCKTYPLRRLGTLKQGTQSQPQQRIRRSRIDAISRFGHAHCPVSAGETALGSLCSPSRRENDTE
jgi:hypothetical protein